MITAIYDLRKHGFKHTETTSLTVTYTKFDGLIRYDVIEGPFGGIAFTRNGVLKGQFDDLNELWEYLTTNKLI